VPTFLLVVPKWRPPLCNSWRGRHWSVAHRLRKQATQLLGAYALERHVPRAAGRRRVSVEIVLAPRQGQPDRDAFDKLLLDALVGAGLLLDDGERGLAGRVEVAFRRGDASTWGMTIVLEDDPDTPVRSLRRRLRGPPVRPGEWQGERPS
jgi:hypothetical protein